MRTQNSLTASDYIFPRPIFIRKEAGAVQLPRQLGLSGIAIPQWLTGRFQQACRAAGVHFQPAAATTVQLAVDPTKITGNLSTDICEQAYELSLTRNGVITIIGGGAAGLQFGIITLCHLLEACGAGAPLRPLLIRDHPLYRLRGVQVDMAREFFPPVAYLRRVIDRLVDLKVNTLWLYIENHFHAPGLEDLSPPGGLTPAQALEISEYGRRRGIDVVPGTNVLSHMEGWFRLERYADFCDGKIRSYPVLTDRRAMQLVKRYLTELAKAFPSKNFQAGLDELLFTGSNPVAIKEIARKTKAGYYADFACEVIDFLKAKGKTVWIWDDMVVGKNVYRPEGFNADAPKALARIPRDVILTHWYYWTDSDGKHTPIIKRVAAAKRPFIVASATRANHSNGLHLELAAKNQTYLARVGKKAGAFGYVCTHWGSQCGFAFETGWPLLAMSAECAWSGGDPATPAAGRALSFVVTGELTGSLADYLHTLSAIEDELKGASSDRSRLITRGPHNLWQKWSAAMPPARRKKVLRLLAQANRHHARIENRDPGLKRALAMPASLHTECIHILAAFDRAWHHYHAAAESQVRPGGRTKFQQSIQRTVAAIGEAAAAVQRYRLHLRAVEKAGHTPYDSHALGLHVAELRKLGRLIRQVARSCNGLPYFGKLLYAPDNYYISNLRQLQVQNTYFERYPGELPWPVRWKQPRQSA